MSTTAGPRLQQTQLTEWLTNGVDPEVRAIAVNLVSALGGPPIEESEVAYVPGDDALGVLRDLRRWVRQEQQADRLEVPRCLAELGLPRDLVQLIGYARTKASSTRAVTAGPGSALVRTTAAAFHNKLLLLALDLLTALTWPVEIDELRLRKSHFAHIPVVRRAQQETKAFVLAENVLTAVVMACGKVLQEREEKRARFEFDSGLGQGDGVLRLGLYLVRNMLLGGPDGPEEEGKMRSSVIVACAQEGIFDLLLALGSNVERDFGFVDVIVLEIVFYMLRGVDVKSVMEYKDAASSQGLRDLLSKEKEMKARDSRTARSRHSRFGGLVWVKEGDRVKTVSVGKTNFTSEVASREWEDSRKKPRAARGRREAEDETNGALEFATAVRLSREALKALKPFLSDFVDSSFNPVFKRVGAALSSNADRVLERSHGLMFFYLSSFFLEWQKMKRDKQAGQAARAGGLAGGTGDGGSGGSDDDDDGFSVIAAVLTRPTFNLLHSQMEQCLGSHSFMALQAQMKCFTQMMLVLQDMHGDERHPDNADIAQNMIDWLFYDETVHDRALNILRLADRRSVYFLNTATEFVSIFGRMIEGWGGVAVAKKVKKRAAAKGGSGEDGGQYGSEGEEEDEQLEMREKKFDAQRFAVRMSGDATIKAFAAFLTNHEELDAEQLKRCHRFFYRAAFKLDLAVHLWRVPLVKLFLEVGKRGRPSGSAGGAGGSSLSSILSEWHLLATHLFKKLTRQIQKRPETLVEMLFTKTSWSWANLEHGPDHVDPNRPTSSSGRAGREPREVKVTGPFEFKPVAAAELSAVQRVGVAVMLLGKDKDVLTRWLATVLGGAGAGPGGENGDASRMVLVASSEEELKAVTFNGHFHLLLSELGFTKNDCADSEARPDGGAETNVTMADATLDDAGAAGPNDSGSAPPAPAAPPNSWKLPASASDALKMLHTASDDPPFDDIKTARKQVRKVRAAGESSPSRPGRRRRSVAFSDSDRSGSGTEEEADLEALFPLGGPTPRRPDGEARPAQKKKKRLRRNREQDGDDEDDDEEERTRKAQRRKKDAAERELEKQRRIKSSLFVHDSDDETDEERDRLFFDLEEKMRKQATREASGPVAAVRVGVDPARAGGAGAGGASGLESAEELDSGSAGSAGERPQKKRRRVRLVDQLQASVGAAEEEQEADESDSDVELISEADVPPLPRARAGAGLRTGAVVVDVESGDGGSGSDSDGAELAGFGRASTIADRLRAAKAAAVGRGEGEEDAEEDVPVRAGRRRLAGPFADSSSDGD